MDWVFDRGDDFGRVTDAQTSRLGSSTSGNALGLEGLSRMAMVDAGGALPASSSPDCYAPRAQLEVCFLRWWASDTYRFGLGYAFDRWSYDSLS